MATLELAATKGLGNVSTNMIADRVGIKKPSLYKHFTSKEEIVQQMYEYLREKAKENTNVKPMDYKVVFQGKTAFDILKMAVENYMKMTRDSNMMMLYKVIYSERSISTVAAEIMAEETEKMILATKQMFYALQIHGLLNFRDPDMSALTFVMTIHGLMEYEIDRAFGSGKEETNNKIIDYLKWFCKENAANA